jgi:ATP-dependent helicase/DNAse subunit B
LNIAAYFVKIKAGVRYMSIVMYKASTKRLATLSILKLLKDRDKSIHHVIVVPDRCAFNIEKMLFDIVGEDSFFDVDVMTVTRLCRQRLKDISSKKILSKQSGVAIIKRLLLENKDKLVELIKTIYKEKDNKMSYTFDESLFDGFNDIFIK